LNTENEGTGVRESNGERKSAEGKEERVLWFNKGDTTTRD